MTEEPSTPALDGEILRRGDADRAVARTFRSGFGGGIDQMSMLRAPISRSTFSLYPDLTRTNAPAAIPGFLRLSETLRDHVTAANGCGADWQSVMRPVSARNARRP